MRLTWVLCSSLFVQCTSLIGKSHLHNDNRTRSYTGYPDVFLFGAQKAGTSSLHDVLVNYHLAANSTRSLAVESFDKEPQVFSYNFNNDSLNRFKEGFENNLRRYGDNGHKMITIDSSPNYFGNPVTYEIFHEFFDRHHLKTKKFILILREPVSRLFSWYNHLFGECARAMKHRFDQVLDPYLNQCNYKAIGPTETVYRDNFKEYYHTRMLPFGKDYGNFSNFLIRWTNVIDRRQIFIINMEKLFDHTKDSLTRLFEFLEITEHIENIPEKMPRVNDHSEHCDVGTCENDELIDCSFYHELAAHYSESNEILLHFVNNVKGKPPTEPHFDAFKLNMKCRSSDGS